MRSHLVSAVCFILIAAVPAGAVAADNPQKAKALFEQGKTFFDLGQFDKAIESWQDGYKAKPDPGFLYNIGQAYRLSGDPQKAIFFYKRFLGYSPKAPNRADIEQKIAAMQKQLAEGDKGKPSTAPPGPRPDVTAPSATPPPAPPPPVATTPPPGAPPPGPVVVGSAPPPFAPGTPPGGEAFAGQPPLDSVAVTPPPPLGADSRRFDLGAAIGADMWASGLAGSSVQPSFAFTLTGGYTFLGSPGAAVRFRMGALFGFTSLDETDAKTKDSFVSLLLVPSLRVRLGASRLSLQTDFGIGLLAVSGLNGSSAFLVKESRGLEVKGAQPMLELRPAVLLGYRVGPLVELFAGPALAYSPKRPHFYAPISRVELLAGVSLRL